MATRTPRKSRSSAASMNVPDYISESQYAMPMFGVQASPAGRLYSSSTQRDVSRNAHVRAYDTIIASGGVEAAYIAGTSFATAAWLTTRTNDISWSLGTLLLSFFVAGGAREDAAIRDIGVGALASSAAVLTVRMMGELKLRSGQQ